MDKLEIAIVGLVVLVVGWCIAVVADMALAKDVHLGTGQVVERVYKPESSSTGVGYAYGKGGGPVVTHHHESEEWLAIVDFQGETIKAKVSPHDWKNMESGQKCQVYQSQGWISSYGYWADTPAKGSR